MKAETKRPITKSGHTKGLPCAKTAERIEVLFAVKTLGGPRNVGLDGGPDPNSEGGRGSTFNAAFAKLLWPLVTNSAIKKSNERTISNVHLGS